MVLSITDDDFIDDVIGDVIGDVMWSRNRLYILLVYHRLCSISTYGLGCLRKGDEHPTYASVGVCGIKCHAVTGWDELSKVIYFMSSGM